jgi:hypothetical protein
MGRLAVAMFTQDAPIITGGAEAAPDLAERRGPEVSWSLLASTPGSQRD